MLLEFQVLILTIILNFCFTILYDCVLLENHVLSPAVGEYENSKFSEIFWIFISPTPPNVLLQKYEINNYHKIIYIIFGFSLVLLSLSSI